MATQTHAPSTSTKQHRTSRAFQRIGKDTRSLQAFFTKFMNDWSMNLSAALAYNLLMAIFPIALAILSILGFILNSMDQHGYNNLIYNQLGSIFPSAVSSGLLQNITLQLGKSSGFLGIVAIILAIFNGSRLFILIEGCFGIIYHIRQRPLIQQNIMAIGMLLLFVILIPVMVFVSTGPTFVFTILQNTPLGQVPGSGFIFGLGGLVGGFLVAWILFQVIYMVVPNQRISFRNSWPGAVAAAIALEVYLILFPLYVSRFLTGYAGQVGFAIILLVFFYYFAVILLLGAEVNAFFAEKVESTPYDLVTMMHLVTSHLSKTRDQQEQQAAASHKDIPTESAMDTKQLAIDTAAQLAAMTTAQELSQAQAARQEDHLSSEQEKKAEKRVKKGPSKVVTLLEAVAGTALAFGLELFRLRRKK